MYGRDPRLPIDARLLEAQETYEDTDDYRCIITDRFLTLVLSQKITSNWHNRDKRLSMTKELRAYRMT